MRRVLVVGISGAGKTTFARALAEAFDLPFHEMDDLAIGPGWSTPPGFEADVEAITATGTWVFDSYGYEQVRDRMWARADTVVWLDYPRRTTFPRILRRSLRRTLRRERVFHGNRETLGSWFTRDHPAWHAWREHDGRRAVIVARLAEERHAHLVVHRFADPAAAGQWLTGVSPLRGPAR